MSSVNLPPSKSKPEKSALYRFLGNAFVQAVLVFVALAVAFSGKLDSHGTIVALLIGWLLGSIGIYSHCSTTTRRKIFAGVVILAYSCLFLVLNNYLSGRPADGVELPLIEISHNTVAGILPIALPPRSTTDIVILAGNNKGMLEHAINDKDVTSPWPSTEKKPLLGDFVSVLKISNHDSIFVFNVVVPLTFEFKQNALPGQKAATVIASNSQDWLIDKIAPGDSAPLYFVNETKYLVETTLPEYLSLEVQGKKGIQGVPVTKRQIGISDRLPITSVPSFYDWSTGRPKWRLPVH